MALHLCRYPAVPRRSTLLSLLFVGAMALLTTACDEAEQGRALNYEKGTYLGPYPDPLENEQLHELRQRAKLQGGS